jgi:hypothetical protein
VSVSFATSGVTLPEGGAPTNVQVVLHTSLVATTDITSVTVFDRATGTAAAGSDYAAFAPQVVSFPAASVDGATQSVAFAATNDMSVDGASETAKLGLMDAVGGAAQGLTTFTATITDIHTATISFSAAASTLPDESTGARIVTVTLDLPVGVSLGAAVRANVSDAGGGSATAGVDYAALATQQVTFAAGSADGANTAVNVQVLDDAAIEADETVRLALSAASSGSALGAPSLHQITIPDDDTPSDAALIASAGATGVENALAYDELVVLGTQTVGAGPNAGTRVRVINAGGAAMDLGAPRLTGTNPNDFSVTLEAAPTPFASFAGDLPPDALSPLLPSTKTSGPGVALALDSTRLTALATHASATLPDFPVPGVGTVTLALRRMPLPIATDSVLRVDGFEVPGGIASVIGDLSLWTGSAVELPGSRVFLALSSDGTRGQLVLPDAPESVVHLTSEAGDPTRLRAVRGDPFGADGSSTDSFYCEDPIAVPGGVLPAAAAIEELTSPGAEPLTVVDCRLAIETDTQLYAKFGSTNALTTYVTQLIAAVSAQYFEDVQATLSIAYLGVYTAGSDPWTSQDSGGNATALLAEFVAAWAPSNWPAQANLAHFISGASLGGGVAYLNALCSTSFGFGVSGNIAGTINWNGWTGAPGNFTWDFVVVAHELGHNFGSNHTHSYCPPLDQCSANCSGPTSCSQGTIMSYCHTCGGMDNIDLEFHPVTANIMRQAVNASCLGLSSLAGGDYVQYLLRFNPLTTTGQRNATLEFAHDAAGEPDPFRVRVRGTAQ